jgi:hypothetical protein
MGLDAKVTYSMPSRIAAFFVLAELSKDEDAYRWR